MLSRKTAYSLLVSGLFLCLLLGLLRFSHIPSAHATGDTVDEIHYSFGDTPNSVWFNWHGDETNIDYGLTTSYGSQAVAIDSAITPVDMPAATNHFREVELTGLQPNTIYHYRIGASGLDHTFTTIPTDDFNWVDVGDTSSTFCGTANAHYWMTDTQNLIAAQIPNFVTHGGDISYANECGVPAVHQLYVDIEAWSHSAAFQPVWGNHEYAKPNVDSLPGVTTEDTLANYKGRSHVTNAQTVNSDTITATDQPGCGRENGGTSTTNTCLGEDWGWFKAGHVLFIAYPEPYANGQAQADWGAAGSVTDTLMAAAQNDPTIDFIVTYGHRPVYSSLLSVESDSTTPKLKSSLDRLSANYSPNAAHPNGKYILNIAHHVHGEEAFSAINGLVNITNGGGGAGQTTYSNPGDPNSIYKTVHPGILSAHYDATAHTLTVNLLCGPDYAPNPKEHCTYNVTNPTILYSQTFQATTTAPANQAPVVSFSGASINQGDTYTTTGSFTDPDSTIWPNPTVNYGDGSAVESLFLNPDNTFSLSHTYSSAGTYTVTVQIPDDSGNTGTQTATVTVADPANQAPVVSLSGASINQGDTYSTTGSFTDADSTSWSGTVNYGDGTVIQSLTINGNNFSLSHPYTTAGTYTVTVTVTDNQQAAGSQTATVTVAATTPVACPATPAGWTEWSPNLSVETNLTGLTGVYNSNSNAATRVQPTGGSFDGLWAMQATPKAAGTAGINAKTDWVTSSTLGKIYTGSAYVKASFAGEKIAILVRETNQAGSGVGGATTTTTTLNDTTTWHQVTSNSWTAVNSGDIIKYSIYATNFTSTSQNFQADCLSLTSH